ncbi:A-kinase anchor protein 17A-like isoform X2 [Prorops nasuta]
MEKIRSLILPDKFASIKVSKSTLEFIRLEGDLQDRCRLQHVLARLDCQKLNLAGFPNCLKIRAVEAKDDFPTRHTWDSYFRDAKHMNELKAGERPDTIHITGLPLKWFSEDGSDVPSELLITKIFKKWGALRRVDVPAADTYRSRMRLETRIQKFSYEDGIFFDAYIQYIEYVDFVRAMDALRGMKLLKKDSHNSLTASIKVDFDKTKHMSDSSVAHRDFERKRLIAQDALAADKLRRKEEAEAQHLEELKKREKAELVTRAKRRDLREEKRKRKALTIFRKQEEDKVSMKIAREEKKLIKAQRQLESIRLLDELFDRIKLKVENKEIKLDQITILNSKKGEQCVESSIKVNLSSEAKKDKKSKKVKKKKDKKGKKKKKKQKKDAGSSSENDSNITDDENNKHRLKSVLTKSVSRPIGTDAGSSNHSMLECDWYPRYSSPCIPSVPLIYFRGRRKGRYMLRGRGRGMNWCGGHNLNALQNFNPHLYDEQYYQYFAHLAGQDCKKDSRSRSRSRRSKSYSGRMSRSRTRTRTRSRSKSRSRSKTKTRMTSRHRSNSRKRSKSRSRSYTRRRKRTSKSKSNSRSRRRSRSKSRSRSQSSSRNHREKRKRYTRSSSKVKITRAKSRSASPCKRSRSSSWSLPQSPDRRRSCSWSKTADKCEQNLGDKVQNVEEKSIEIEAESQQADKIILTSK